MTIQQILSKSVQSALRELYGTEASENQISLQKTRKDFIGDYTLVVFPLLKISKKSPEDTAQILGNYLEENCSEVKSYNVIKGFLNIELKDAYWSQLLKEDNVQRLTASPTVSKPISYVVEYSSPNTNKPLHLGHIRNNLLGQSVADLLSYVGHKVYKVNLVNDRGIHICKSMLAWHKWGNGETPEVSGIKGDFLVGKYYVMFESAYQKQVKELISQGKTEDEAKKEAPLIKEAQQMLKAWEDNDAEIRQLWQKMNGWVLEGFEKTYKKLGINFHKTYYESETYSEGKNMVAAGIENGFFNRKSDHSVWVDLKDEGLDEKLLLRKDGTSVYITQDLGTAERRYNDFKADKYIYVVGNEQNYHFKVLKSILKKIGKSWHQGVEHLSYGMVELPDGKMKSREGKVVDADILIDEMILTAQKHTEDLGKTDKMGKEEAEDLFFKLAMGALKYYILKVDPQKNMVFNPEESIDFNGHTGPFIQYAYVRSRSLKAKAEKLLPAYVDVDYSKTVLHDKERILLKRLHDFPEVITEAAEKYSPALLANYMYEVAKEYNQFYHELPILKEPDLSISFMRLSISELCAKIIQKGMWLLGISMPDRM